MDLNKFTQVMATYFKIYIKTAASINRNDLRTEINEFGAWFKIDLYYKDMLIGYIHTSTDSDDSTIYVQEMFIQSEYRGLAAFNELKAAFVKAYHEKFEGYYIEASFANTKLSNWFAKITKELGVEEINHTKDMGMTNNEFKGYDKEGDQAFNINRLNVQTVNGYPASNKKAVFKNLTQQQIITIGYSSDVTESYLDVMGAIGSDLYYAYSKSAIESISESSQFEFLITGEPQALNIEILKPSGINTFFQNISAVDNVFGESRSINVTVNGETKAFDESYYPFKDAATYLQSLREGGNNNIAGMTLKQFREALLLSLNMIKTAEELKREELSTVVEQETGEDFTINLMYKNKKIGFIEIGLADKGKTITVPMMRIQKEYRSLVAFNVLADAFEEFYKANANGYRIYADFVNKHLSQVFKRLLKQKGMEAFDSTEVEESTTPESFKRWDDRADAIEFNPNRNKDKMLQNIPQPLKVYDNKSDTQLHSGDVFSFDPSTYQQLKGLAQSALRNHAIVIFSADGQVYVTLNWLIGRTNLKFYQSEIVADFNPIGYGYFNSINMMGNFSDLAKFVNVLPQIYTAEVEVRAKDRGLSYKKVDDLINDLTNANQQTVASRLRKNHS